MMKEVDSEKYFGDVINKKESIQATIENRKSKAKGFMSEVLSIINEIPLGKHTTTVAMKLRDVMLPTLMEYYLKVKQKKKTKKHKVS